MFKLLEHKTEPSASELEEHFAVKKKKIIYLFYYSHSRQRCIVWLHFLFEDVCSQRIVPLHIQFYLNENEIENIPTGLDCIVEVIFEFVNVRL
jgi:hypothetical protein